MSEEFFGIKYLYRMCLEIRLISPKLSSALFCAPLIADFYYGRHCSSQVVHPNFFRPGATDLQLRNIVTYLTYTRTECGVDFKNHDITLAVHNMEDIIHGHPKNFQINLGFRYEEDYLYCEDMRVCDLLNLKDVSSPVYVYSKKQIEANINKYKTAMKNSGRNIQLSYSVKANMNPSILELMRNHGLFLTLVSGHELRLALDLGQEPGKIVFNGNGKMNWEVDLACRSGVLLNVDSIFNMRQTIDVCKAGGYVANVLFRINPDINPNVHGYVSTGQEGSKFGISADELEEVLEMATTFEKIRVVGLHCHIGSTIREPEKFKQSTRVLVDLFNKLRSRFPDLYVLNLGGGLSIPYKSQISLPQKCKQVVQCEIDKNDDQEIARLYDNLLTSKLTLSTFLEAIKPLPRGKEIFLKLQEQVPSECLVPEPNDLLSSISDIIPPEAKVILEPGRSLVGNSAILLSRVLGTKLSKKKNFIVIDGAMTEVIRPCLYGAYHHVELAEPSRAAHLQTASDQSKLVWDVVGPVCESADFIGKDRLLLTPHEGCSIAVFDTGAYCSSMGSNYNMRVRPAELLIDGEKVKVIRRSETFEDMMKLYTNYYCFSQ